MATPQQLREWLRKMQYHDPNPTDEALQILCRGPMGQIFQQVIDKVKPKQEIELIKKNILVNRISNENTSQNHEEIEQVKLYKKKKSLQKQLNEIKANNTESDTNLQHLMSKIKSKNAKLQALKHTIRENEKETELFKAKCEELNQQIEICEKLRKDSDVSGEDGKHCDEDKVIDTIKSILPQISEIISNLDHEIIPPNQERKSSVDSQHLQTSMILSSSRKPLSTKKRHHTIANSTRKNIFESFSNVSMISSTSKRHNFSKISFSGFDNTALSLNSTFSNGSVDKCTEVFKELENLCWNNQKLQNCVENTWQSGSDIIFKVLIDLKMKHKTKIAQMVAENKSRLLKNVSFNSTQKNLEGMDQLYSFHVTNEIKRLNFEREQQKISDMLDINLNDSLQSRAILESTEFGLQSSIEHLRNCVQQLSQNLPNNRTKLHQTLLEIESVQNEMASTKTKIETNLCLLYDCNTWLEKSHKNVLEIVREPMIYSEYDLLPTKLAKSDVQRFLSCPFQNRNQLYFESWSQIFGDPELLELIQRPYFSPESVINFHLDQKKWFNKLLALQKECDSSKINKQSSLLQLFDAELNNDSLKSSSERMQNALHTCAELLSSFNNFKGELKLWVETPMNKSVAKNLKFQNKDLEEFVDMYEALYKQLD